jgi:hypothetical protein
MAIKLRIKSRRDPALPPSPYNNIVSEAMSVTRKLNALRQFPACKLTAEAYLEETLAADENASMKGVRKLREWLERKPLPVGLTHSARTLARMIAGLKGPAWGSPPVKFPWRLQTSFGTPETTAELIAFDSTTLELFGVSILIVNERSPDCWGTCESSADYAEQVAELEARQAELFKKLETQASTEDLLIADDPHIPTAFKVSDGKVPLAPRQDAGQRLVNYLMAQRAAKN